MNASAAESVMPVEPSRPDDPSEGLLSLPVIGRVAAGSPIEAVENTEKVIRVPAARFRHKPDYLLRVRGESMIGEGILDNDLIAVKRQSTAEPGQIVVARHGDDVTVKELRIDNGEVVLIPANEAHEPIRIPADMVTIEGVYVGLVRETDVVAA
ncbi:LexA repressor [Salinisphaera sp. PC39]|uniref:transcriptional repressor LexA n=1 Tax=Salinisphaera sp. PC39 TaxID=1304156 RepID=UPI0033419A13